MKTILKILDYAPSYRGNFIDSLEYLENKLKEKSGRIVYVFPEKAKNLDWILNLINNGKAIYFIETSFFSKKIKFKNILFLNEIIKKEKIDIVHTHFVFYNYSLFILKKMFCRKLKFYGHFHNHFILPNTKTKLVKKFITKHTFDKIIGVGESVTQSIINQGVSQNKTVYIKNAINFKRLDNFEILPLRENENQKLVLILGWPFLRKGVDFAIEAIDILRKKEMDIKLFIALSGGKDIVSEEIKTYYGEFPDWIQFLEPRNDIATYYNSVDMFFSVGREEGLNYAVVEAAYCSPYVLISDIPGNPQDIPSLFKFKIPEYKDLSAQIDIILKLSEKEKESIKEAQRKFVLKEYNLQVWAENVLKLY